MNFVPHIDVWGFCFWCCIRSFLLLLPPVLPILTHTHLPHTYITHTHSLAHTSSISSLAHTSSISSSIPSNTSLITHCITHHPLTHSLTHSLTHTHTHTHTLTHPTNNHSLTHSLTITLTHTHTSLTLCVAGAGLGALQRGRMYALASLWRPSGVPWSAALPVAFAHGRRGTWCTAKGSDVHPGVPLASLWRPSGVPWSPPLCRWLLVITTSSQHHIPKHHLTHHNFTSHATRSVYLRLHTFTLLPPNLTLHENNITSHTYTYV